MTKQCLSALREIRKRTGCTDAWFSRTITGEFVADFGDADKSPFSFPKLLNETDSILDTLLASGYICEVLPSTYRLTQKGIHPVWYWFEHTFSTWILPIIISAATTLITLWLTGVLTVGN